MEKFIINKSSGYLIISTHHLRNKELSLKAKGLMSIILTLPDDWKFSIPGLATLSKDGVDSLKTALKELEDHGYIKIVKQYNSNNQFVCDSFHVYEKPQINKGEK